MKIKYLDETPRKLKEFPFENELNLENRNLKKYLCLPFRVVINS